MDKLIKVRLLWINKDFYRYNIKLGDKLANSAVANYQIERHSYLTIRFVNEDLNLLKLSQF